MVAILIPLEGRISEQYNQTIGPKDTLKHR